MLSAGPVAILDSFQVTRQPTPEMTLQPLLEAGQYLQLS
jgi:hypothetical protein